MKVYKTVALVVAFLIACLGLSSAGQIETRPVEAAERPNVVLILADDLDAQLLEEHSADYPNLRKLAAEGTSFENAFVTDSLCCPSRATILRGQYAHNHQVLTNEPPIGGYTRFRDLGHENSTVATWLQSSGYKTTLIGKYMNGYGNTTAVPPGWNDWYSDSLDSTGQGKVNDNGTIGPYDGYLTDVLANRATEFVQGAAGSDQPYFMYLAPRNPHPSQEPAPRHQDSFSGATAPRPPSFNEANVSDKPSWVRDQPLLTSAQIADIDSLYRKRLQQMMAVDEMVGRLFDTLQASGELDNTYVLFTSDNGFHMGEHRLLPSKWTAYEEDSRVPLIVRGPGVPAGRTLNHMVLNNDFAPTFADLAGAEAPSFVDGRSLKPLLTANPPTTGSWRSAFLEEGKHGGYQHYEALRTEDYLYVEYPKTTGQRELYDLRADPYQLQSQHATANPAFVAQLKDRLGALRNCATASCRAAEDSAVDTVAPMIVSTTPPNGTAEVAVSVDATATFSEVMDPLTIDGSTFTLSEQVSGSTVAASVDYDPTAKKATLKPSSALRANTSYVARISTGAKDVAGNTLATEESWSFTTTSTTCTMTGTSASETLTGTSGDDVICGLGGNDTIKGAGGNDTIKGEVGADKLFGGPGDDTLDGGTGADTADFSGSLAAVTASLTTKSATGEGSDTLPGVDNLTGSPKNDALTGNGSINSLNGGGGADTLEGFGGNDKLYGLAGNDTLRGGTGNDSVVGGGSADNLFGEDGDDAVNSKDNTSGNDSLDGGAHLNGDTKTTDATEKSVVGFP